MSSYFGRENLYFVPNVNSTGGVKSSKQFNNLGYEAKVNDKWNTSFNVTYTNYDMKIDTAPFHTRKSGEVTAEWTNFIDLGSKSKLIVGGLYNHQNESLKKPTHVDLDTTIDNFAFYTQLDYHLFESLKLIGGIQLNKREDQEYGIQLLV